MSNTLIFDIDEINDLKTCYQQTIESILDELPDVNWNSPIETKAYFSDNYGIQLKSVQIEELQKARNLIQSEEGFIVKEQEQLEEELNGVIELYKLKYTIRNYLDNIIKHNKNGVIELREINGELRMPNKRMPPSSPDILACLL